MENNHLRAVLEAAFTIKVKAAPVITYCNLVGVGRTDAPKPTADQLQTFYNLCEKLRDAVREGQTFFSSDYAGDRESLEIAAAAVDKVRGYCETLSSRIARDSSFSELLSKDRPAAVIWSTMAASLFALRGVFITNGKGKPVQPITNQDTPPETQKPVKKGRPSPSLIDYTTAENIAKMRPFCEGRMGKPMADFFMYVRHIKLIDEKTEVAAFCREFGLTNNQAGTVSKHVTQWSNLTAEKKQELLQKYAALK